MRVIFKGNLPSQRGGAHPVFIGTPFQRGYGFGSLFKGLMRAVLPIAKQALPFAKSAGRAFGREALLTGANVAQDALAGADVGQSLEKHSKRGARKLLKKGTKKLQRKLKQPQQKGGALGRVPATRTHIKGRVTRIKKGGRKKFMQADIFG